MYAYQPGQQASKQVQVEKNAATVRRPGMRTGRSAGLASSQQRAGGAEAAQRTAVRQRAAVLSALSVRGRRLEPRVRTEMESRLGADLSDVRVHTGPASDRAAQAVAAQAFTAGSHLVFGRGRYDPLSVVGKRVLLHELAHVLQQRRGPVAGTGDQVRISHPADRFERQAETVARRALGVSPSQRRGMVETGASPRREVTSARSALAIQRLVVNYGGVNQDDVGTTMQAEIDPMAPVMGSKPSTRPSWWPGCTTAAGKAWMKNYMVQGHLLNEHLGGPGNTMDNLTPITKSANSEHHAKVEKKVKALAQTDLVRYHVTADYTRHPTGADLTGIPGRNVVNNDLDANVAPKLAYQLYAEYNAYNRNTGRQTKTDGWEINNES